MANPIIQLDKSELKSRYMALQTRVKNMRTAAEKPLKQGGMGLAATAGGAAGGLVAGLVPTIMRVPTDAILGGLVALPCLAGAGGGAADIGAMVGWGMVSGSTSRVSHRATRNWREKRAADAGDALAKEIVDLQARLDKKREERDAASKKATK